MGNPFLMFFYISFRSNGCYSYFIVCKSFILFLIDDNKRESDTEVTREILLFVDGLAPELSLDNARIIFVNKSQGFTHLAKQIAEGIFVTLVILLVGRGEVWQPDRVFFAGLEKVISCIKTQNSSCIIVLGVSLPAVRDSRAMVCTFGFWNDKLAVRCACDPRLEHARPGKALLCAKGPIHEYFDELGNINEYSGDVIARALERKIYSAKLFQRVTELVEGEPRPPPTRSDGYRRQTLRTLTVRRVSGAACQQTTVPWK